MLWVGVDIGGTFTDVIGYDPASGRLLAAKSLSTPASPVRAVLEGIAKLGADYAEIGRFVHGTTRVTNALLENSGVPVALITTRGFRDVTEMARGHRRRLYSVKETAPERLVPRVRRFEVEERLQADGSVLRPLDEAGVEAAIESIASFGEGVGGVAICFLHSYRNPVHENRVAELVRKRLPKLALSTSAEVVPEIGEYERFATTVQNVAVKPIVDAYLAELQGALKQSGFAGELSIMTSGGGVVSANDARRVPMQLALSGPAGGVAASAYGGGLAGFPNLITCDMGGTSADVCLIKGGQPAMTNLSDIAGYPNKTFQIEIKTIGAGGGSLAWVDVGGELCIGPQSAGSTPGPACYGRGGTQPTTTDAHLIVGHLDTSERLGGEVGLDLEAARRAMQALADRIGIASAEELALGVIRLAVAKMTSAIKEISIARGHDPRDFTLLPFGGAGPMHATALADELGMEAVLVPRVPGNLSALGFVTARARHDLVRIVMLRANDAALPEVTRAFEVLAGEARERLAAGGLKNLSEAELSLSLGMRIRGQTYELLVPLAAVPATAAELAQRFREAYEARYAYVPSQIDLEIVSCRITALGPVQKVDLACSSGTAEAGAIETNIYTRDGWVRAAVRQRALLEPGDAVDGPVIVRESGATTVVGAGWRVTVDKLRNLVIRKAK